MSLSQLPLQSLQPSANDQTLSHTPKRLSVVKASCSASRSSFVRLSVLQTDKMLSSLKPSVAVKAPIAASGRVFVAAPVSARQPVRRLAPVARPALLLDQPLAQDVSRQSNNVLSDLINMVVHWLEPQEQSHVG